MEILLRGSQLVALEERVFHLQRQALKKVVQERMRIRGIIPVEEKRARLPCIKKHNFLCRLTGKR